MCNEAVGTFDCLSEASFKGSRRCCRMRCVEDSKRKTYGRLSLQRTSFFEAFYLHFVFIISYFCFLISFYFPKAFLSAFLHSTRVYSMSSSLCALERNHPSNWAGGMSIPAFSISLKNTEYFSVSHLMTSS